MAVPSANELHRITLYTGSSPDPIQFSSVFDLYEFMRSLRVNTTDEYTTQPDNTQPEINTEETADKTINVVTPTLAIANEIA
jgi:hypothetical protein